MNPEVVRYIVRYRGTYTREAITRALEGAGHPRAEIDAAWASVESGVLPPPPPGEPEPAAWEVEGETRERGLVRRGLSRPSFWVTFLGYIAALAAVPFLLGALGTPEGGALFALAWLLGGLVAAIILVVRRRDSPVALALGSALLLVAVLPFVLIVILAGICVVQLGASGALG